MEIIQDLQFYGEMLIEIPIDTKYVLLDLFIPQAQTHQSYSFFSIEDPKVVMFNNGAEKGIAYKTDDNKIKVEGNCMCNIIFFKSNL